MKLKTTLGALALTTAMMAPALANAKNVTITTDLANYGGRGAYLAYYVTDASGAYVGTVWMSGGRSKYYKHLSGWVRASGYNVRDLNGVTGASVGSGRSLKLTMNLSDKLFDAGYTLHVDAAAENFRESPNDVAIPLTTKGAGQASRGRRYVARLQYDF